MKKIFTLIAVGAMALTAGAQEKALFDHSVTYQDGQVISSDNAKLTLGNDMKGWVTGASKIAADGYLSEFGQTVTVSTDDGNVEQFSIVTVNGSNNPKDQAESGKGSGINCAEGKTTARLPQNGSYYVFTPATDGKVQVGIVLNANKAFYLIDATDATPTEDGYITVNLPDANLHSYVIKGLDGSEVALEDDGDSKGGKVTAEKVTGTLEFDVVGGKSYYFFCSGSKLGCFGYIFEGQGGEQTGGLDIEPALPVTFNSWDVSFLIKKTDVKAGDKFVFSGEPITVDGWQWGPQILPKSNENWSDLGNALILGEDGKAIFEVTEEYAATINGFGGLRVQGMGVIVTAVDYVGGDTPQPADGEKINMIDNFNYTWNNAETFNRNADGTVTYNGKQWGGLAAWVAVDDAPVDWSKYAKLVFEFAEPTPAPCQGFVQGVNPDDGKELNHTWSGNAGITKLECPFEGKDVTHIKQVALQPAEDATYQISAIYLVMIADGIENTTAVKPVYDVNAPVYNLAGMRVSKDYKGIVIQNGRKFIQK